MAQSIYEAAVNETISDDYEREMLALFDAAAPELRVDGNVVEEARLKRDFRAFRRMYQAGADIKDTEVLFEQTLGRLSERELSGDLRRTVLGQLRNQEQRINDAYAALELAWRQRVDNIKDSPVQPGRKRSSACFQDPLRELLETKS